MQAVTWGTHNIAAAFLHVCLIGQTKEGLQLLVGLGTVDTERPGSAPVKQRVIEHGLLQRGQVIPHIVGELLQDLTERGGRILGARLRPELGRRIP